jgi:hypothetical protein
MSKTTKQEEKKYELTHSQLKNIVREGIKRYKLAEANDQFEQECRAEADELIQSFEPEATKIEVGDEWFSVQLSNKDEAHPFKVWMDISIRDNDVYVDWNQYIFHLNNSDDVVRKMFQEDTSMFEACDSEAVWALENGGYIYQDDNANWHRTEKKDTPAAEGSETTPEVKTEEVAAAPSEPSNPGIMTGGGAPKNEDPAEKEFIRTKCREFAKQNIWPHFIAYNMETGEAIPCSNYATAATYKAKGMKIAAL